jgi:uncharacterized cupin superfamily protein
MSKSTSPVFDTLAVPESNATGYPEPFRTLNQHRHYRRLGPLAGLKNFGVKITRIAPGGQSSCRHAHSKQDEFVYILEGETVLETNEGERVMRPGMCAGFPAGTGDAHRFLNRTDKDVVMLIVGDHTTGDEVVYPDVDLAGKLGPDGRFVYTHKDGSSY